MWQTVLQRNTDYSPACYSLRAAKLHEVIVIQGIVKLVVIKPR